MSGDNNDQNEEIEANPAEKTNLSKYKNGKILKNSKQTWFKKELVA